MYACVCVAVPVDEVVETVRDGAATVAQVARACGAGTGCGSCHDRLRALIEAHAAQARERVPALVA